jgi:hypothetical protein
VSRTVTIRLTVGALGTILGGYGAVRLCRQVHWTTGWLASTGAYLFGGPVLHDAVLAPVVALAGVTIARVVPASWRSTVATGLAATGVLVLITVPLLWRPDPAQPNPGLQSRPYLSGLLFFLAALWLSLILTRLLRTGFHRWCRRAPAAGQPADHDMEDR